MKAYWQNYIDGAWVDGGAGRIDVFDPGTGEKLAEHALADAADVDRAVMAAERVHRSGALSELRPVERGRMVQAMGRYLLENIDDIAPVLTQEQGKPLWEAKIEVAGAARYFVIDRRYRLRRIADQERMGKMRKKLRVPHMVYVMRKILQEDRPISRPSLNVFPNAFNRQPLGCLLTFFKSRPHGMFTLIPGFSKRLVQAIQISALSHHPFKRG